jgi:hypothetical protein
MAERTRGVLDTSVIIELERIDSDALPEETPRGNHLWPSSPPDLTPPVIRRRARVAWTD